MKDFIRHKLRIVLEGKRAVHSPSNPVGVDPKTASNSDLIRLTHKLVSLNNEYGQDPYFQDTHEGDGIYMATIHTNGNITIKTPNPKRRLEAPDIGLLWTGPRGNKHVYVRAYRGMEHPDIDSPRGGTAKTSSPAEDAAIKTYLIFGKDILDYVKQNMEGEDDYTSDDKDFTSKTPEKIQYKYDKLEKEKQRQRKSTISMDPDDADEYEKRQQRLKAKYAKFLRK